MVSYKSDDFKRNGIVKKQIKHIGNSFITTTDMYVIFPTNYIDKKLGVIDTVCKIYGVLMFADMNLNYNIMTVPTQVHITPDSLEVVTIDDEPYYRLLVLKNDVLIDDVDVVVMGDMGYYTFDIFLRKGKVPFYLGYFDLLEVFTNLTKYTDNNVSKYLVVLKILIATIARDYNDKSIPYRFGLNKPEDIKTKKVKWIAMSNIYYSYKSTLARIGGSYMKDGMLAAIVDPEKEPTIFENIVRQ